MEWGYENSTKNKIIKLAEDVDKIQYKQEFLDYIKQIFIKNKTDNFFDIITNYPESQNTLKDMKICLDNCIQNYFIHSVKEQISKKLLTPGVATPLIIEIFIRIIKITKFLDPSSFLLEIISEPIKQYLRNRKDTLRCIITNILSEDDISIKDDLGKQYIKSNKNILNREKDDYDNLSSDEDEEAAENWEPMPLSEHNNMLNKTKSSDIISTLVNIFGSPEKFIEQYKRMLAERSVSDSNFSLDNEIKNLELLKLKFGETLLQGCDIIIKDVKDSIKINSAINEKMKKSSLNINNTEFEMNCLIINKNFWPFKNDQIYEIDELDNTIKYDMFLKYLKDKFDNHKKCYSSIKFSRTLNYYSNIGYVDLNLTFDNGTFLFRVSPLSALIINLFDENNTVNFEKYTIDYIADKLKCTNNDVKKKINFFINKGVLSEFNNTFTEEDNIIFYKPNSILKNFEPNGNLIIEEDIFNFEYLENENILNLENAISSILKNAGPRNFEQLFKNLVLSYQVTISEIKLKEILGKMILDQKIFKEGEVYKLIILTN